MNEEHPQPKPFLWRLRSHRFATEWLVCLLVVLACVWLAQTNAIASRADLAFHDKASDWTVHELAQDVVVVAIDDASLKQVGRWPWSRAQQALLVQRLAQASPRGVAVTMIWSDASTDEDDQALATALRQLRTSSRIVLPVWPSDTQWVRPLEMFAREATALGHLSFITDDDGTARRLPLLESNFPDEQPSQWPALSAALLGEKIKRDAQPFERQTVLLSWERQVRTISADTLLKGEVPAEFLRDKWVILGLASTGLGDKFLTPYGPSSSLTPAAHMHAVAVDALENGRWRTQPSRITQWAIGTVLLLAWMAWLWRCGPVVSGWSLLGLLVTLPLLSYGTMHVFSVWWPPMVWLFGIVLAYILWSWRRSMALVKEVTDCAHRLWPPKIPRPKAYAPAARPHGWREVSAVLNKAVGDRVRRDETLQWLSHDLRAPQSAILALLYLAEQKGNLISTKLATEIESRVRETLNLADDFILHVRAEEQEQIRKDVELSQVLYQAREMALPLARQRNMRIEQEDGPDDGAWVVADPRLIERAVFNLLINATRYGIPDTVIQLGVDDTLQGQWRVWVRNEGPSLSQEEWKAAFEPRTRLVPQEDRSGHGLGLAFVKTVAQVHGGKAWAHSDLATGVTEVGFFIPHG